MRVNQIGKRTCNNPKPRHGGQNCAGEGTITRDCYKNDPGEFTEDERNQFVKYYFFYLILVDGGWSEWTDKEENCSKTCGGGLKIWRRTCTNPTPEHGGKKCVGKDVVNLHCNTFPCK